MADGYLIIGKWSFGSGIRYATHVHPASFDKENKRPIVAIFPQGQTQLEGDWDVLGLWATGSIDYSCRDLSVPAAWAYDSTSRTSPVGGEFHRLGMPNMSSICHTGWALGRRLTDELRSLARHKGGTPGVSVDTDHFHAEYTRAEALLRSARVWAMEVWTENEVALDAGEPLSMEQETGDPVDAPHHHPGSAGGGQ